MIEPIRWNNGHLEIIDQTELPVTYKTPALHTASEVWEAIHSLRVRGAPAIGICAAYGVVTGFKERKPDTPDTAQEVVEEVASYLAGSRPTAVNLFWALARMRRAAREAEGKPPEALEARLLEEAHAVLEEERGRCKAIGEHGAALLPERGAMLTHCNTGPLAAGAYGTALAAAFRAHELGRAIRVYADETRPLLQGARLTTWELLQAGIPCTLICDGAAAHVLRQGVIDVVIVGADRIAANGDAANKIGTYHLALAAAAHGVPFYVAAPISTIDRETPCGDGIVIEERDGAEITHGFGRQTAPDGVDVYNPAFDVTPARLIEGIITEHGILRPPYESAIAELFSEQQHAAR
ncbi:MAG: S-methyl-5-thioribose-1-phosphate isomerase [Candidatus Hydrogenedentota bacterium]